MSVEHLIRIFLSSGEHGPFEFLLSLKKTTTHLIPIYFYSLPPRGSAEWKTWMMILFATESAEISFNKIYCKKICQLHFKPNDLQESISCGITRLKLKPGVVPMPIKTPIEVV